MISAQMRSVFVAKENRCTAIGRSPRGMLFRIMLYRGGRNAIDFFLSHDLSYVVVSGCFCPATLDNGR
jgi:hypothetical protein